LVDRLDLGMTLPDAIADPRASQRNAPVSDAEPAFIASPVAATLTSEYGQAFGNPAEIGAATGIDFLDGGLLQAAAEPVRRGGGGGRRRRGPLRSPADTPPLPSPAGRRDGTRGRAPRPRPPGTPRRPASRRSPGGRRSPSAAPLRTRHAAPAASPHGPRRAADRSAAVAPARSHPAAAAGPAAARAAHGRAGAGPP